MNRIDKHPVLEVPEYQEVTFQFEGKTIKANKGFTIAAA